MITPTALEEFRDLYFKEYKIPLSEKEVSEIATKLLNLVKAVYGTKIARKNVDLIRKGGKN